jgi:PDZ domain-containing protein
VSVSDREETIEPRDVREPDLAPSPARPSKRSHRRHWTIGISMVVAIVLLAAGLVIRIPYYTLSPGTSRPTEPLITVDGAQTYDNSGAVDFLTVSLRQATPVEAVASWINPDLELKSEEEILGTQTPDENRNLNLRMMSESKDAAQYQALTRLGYTIPANGTGAVVATVGDGSPAAGTLYPGDVVTDVNGNAVHFGQDLVAAVSASSPGATLTMKVEPFDANDPSMKPARTVTVTLGSRPDDASRPYLGVSTFTRDLSFDFPVNISIDSGQVGGPSAGLAFTLGILDVLTPGSITGGLPIATTGTMSLDGTVGPIGGVHQKVITARRQGVKLMLVPSSEVDEARRYAGDLRIEPVDNLDQALAVLATVGGGNAVLPPARTPATID